MSEKLGIIEGIGGRESTYTETVLWQNPSPSANFAAQTVSLSDSISNYKYIGIKYKWVTTSTSSDMAVYPVDLLKQSVNGGGTDHLEAFMGIQIADNSMYARQIYYASETSIGFSANTRLGNTKSYINSSIPLEILGLNELAQGKKMDDTILWTNASPTSSFSAQTITLSEDMTVYDYIKIVYEYSNSATTILCQVLIPMSDFVTYKADSSRSGVGNLGVFNSTNNSAARSFWYVSATKVGFGAAYLLAQTSANNTVCIPVNIIGCKLS